MYILLCSKATAYKEARSFASALCGKIRIIQLFSKPLLLQKILPIHAEFNDYLPLNSGALK